MTTVQGLLAEYAADHQHPVNQRLHSWCVPAIVVSLVGLLWSLPVPWADAGLPRYVNWATIALVPAAAWWLRLSPALGLGMLVALAATFGLVAGLEGLPVPLWASAAAIFVVAWIGQFVGHGYEGKRPSFFRDLRFLLVGPLWVLAKLYRRLGIRV